MSVSRQYVFVCMYVCLFVSFVCVSQSTKQSAGTFERQHEELMAAAGRGCPTNSQARD